MTYYMFKRGIGRIADCLAEKIETSGLDAAQPYNSIFSSVLNALGVKFNAQVVTRGDGSAFLEVLAVVHLWRVHIKKEVTPC
jgi:hypothetical protein